MYFRNHWLQKTWLDKCLKSPFSEDPSTSNMVNGPNHCWNLRDSTFIIFIDQYEGNWVAEMCSGGYWDSFMQTKVIQK